MLINVVFFAYLLNSFLDIAMGMLTIGGPIQCVVSYTKCVYVRTDLYMKLHTELGRLWLTNDVDISIFPRGSQCIMESLGGKQSFFRNRLL